MSIALSRYISIALMIAWWMAIGIYFGELARRDVFSQRLITRIAWLDAIGEILVFAISALLIQIWTKDRHSALLLMLIVIVAVYRSWRRGLGAAFSWGNDFLHLVNSALGIPVAVWCLLPLIGVAIGVAISICVAVRNAFQG